ncbi:MAG: DsbA family protein [Thermoleophilia bacterium]|nr:DsbA family protein [Thermoleophilia bacterium]
MTGKQPILELIQYTDPYCTWCWGSEPVMRHIEEVYGDQVHVAFVMCGLVQDAASFRDPLNRIGGPGMARQIAEHWREASARHGMPVDADVWLDLDGEFTSTWPANIACKAAQMQDEEKANDYIRRMREAAAAERRFIHRREVQAALARDAGLDIDRFEKDIDSDAAEQAFRADLRTCRDKHVTGYPSFEIRNQEGEEFMFFGYQPYPRFVELFERLAGSRLQAREIVTSEDSILDFIRRRGKVAWREVGEVFSLSKSQAEDWLGRLEGRGLIQRQAAGNGWFYLPAGDGES